MYSSHLGLIIAIAILFGLAAVLAFMGSLMAGNVKAGARARGAAVQARDDAQRTIVASRVQDLRPLLASTLQASRPLCVDIQLPPEPVPVFAIDAELRELLAAVAEHAMRVMPAGATLQVCARVEGRHAVVHWRDPHAVDPRPPLAGFFDAAGAAMAAGARACERIAGRHGGRIYSAPHAGGTLGLTLRLPLHAGSMLSEAPA
jgi:hypothetical protein